MARFQVSITLDTMADETTTEADAIAETRGNLLNLLLDEDSALVWTVQNMDAPKGAFGSTPRLVDECGEDAPFPDESPLTMELRHKEYNQKLAARDAETLPQIKAPK